jgi:hypothetical protein
VLGQLTGCSVKKIQGTHMRALGMDAFPSVRADMQRDFVVEPDPRRAGSPFIFHGDGEPRPAATASRGSSRSRTVHSRQHHQPYLFHLVMQLIPFCEAIACGNKSEARYHPKVIG